MSKDAKKKKYREFTDIEKELYHAGVEDGRNRFRRTCNRLESAMRVLMSEIRRLDEEQPLIGIVLTKENARMLIKALKKPEPSYWHANRLQEKLDKAEKDVMIAIPK